MKPVRRIERSRLAVIAVLAAVVAPLFLSIFAQQGATPVFVPQVPTADRAAGNRVFLEHADVLRKTDADSFMVLVGDVMFTKGPMYMYCDSCHYYPDTESMEAFGNVRMEQGDTLFVYADELVYDGRPEAEIATLYADPGKKVRLINKEVELKTDIFVYDLKFDLGYYNVGGELTDASNRLTSLEGEYVPSTKEANFYTDVHLNSHSQTDTLDIYTDTLYYNTALHIAELNAQSTIVNARGTVYTRRGAYLTDSNICMLSERPTIITSQNQRLIADSVYYNRGAGYAEAFGRMELTDIDNKAMVCGQYGYYNELRDSSYVTGQAVIKEYSEGDTLFLHGRYIETFIELDTLAYEADTIAGIPETFKVDTCHVAVIYPRVRFFRSDLQGVCDSMRFTQRDSMLRMFVNPVIWNQDQQIFGNVIELHLNDSTVDKAILPEFGFAAQLIEGEHYNQISGKKMTAYFIDSDLRHLDIEGNVEIIMYPQESDSTFNKIVNAESSFLAADFKNRVTEKVKMWPDTNGKATPLFMAKRSLYYLAKFKWFGDLRPVSPEDIFVVSDAMEDVMSSAERPAVKPRVSKNVIRRMTTAPDVPADETEAETDTATDATADLTTESAEQTPAEQSSSLTTEEE